MALLHYGATADVQNAAGWTPLHGACRRGHLETVVALVERGADVNATDNQGNTPLHGAYSESLSYLMIQNVGSMLQTLLDHGARTDVQNSEGTTPLHEASRQKLAKVVVFFLERGADIDCKDNEGNTPLHLACVYPRDTRFNRADTGNVALTLLANGAKVAAKNDKGRTPLHEAGCARLNKTVLVLLEHDADVQCKDNDGNTPLYLACSRQNTPLYFFMPGAQKMVVSTFIDNGAELNVQNTMGLTPLHAASMVEETEIMEVLLQRGADVNITDQEGNTPLHLVGNGNTKSYLNSGNTKAASSLVGRDARSDVPNVRGRTPLHEASYRAQVESVKVLLDCGCDVHTTDIDGNTPLHLACEQSLLEAQRQEAYFDSDIINIMDEDYNLFPDMNQPVSAFTIYEYRVTDVVRMLLNKGADRKAHNKAGQTPLVLARTSNFQNVVHMLEEDTHTGAPSD